MASLLPEYDELEIRLTPGRGEAYNVEIESASEARGHGQFLPPNDLDLARFRLAVDPRSRRVRSSTRALDSAARFGSGLFDALLQDASVREVYTAARRDARAANKGLRLRVSLRAAPELAGIPWEFLYDRPRFLAQHVQSPIVRFVELEDPPPPLKVEPPLRIVGMVSRPADASLATLDVEEEQALLERRLEPLIQSGQVTLKWLEEATLRALQQELDHGEECHIFHFIGHGEYDEQLAESCLVLEYPDGRAHRVGGLQLGNVVAGRGSLRLAVLNACEAAQTSAHDPLAGVATSLMEFDVPAVVAMQFAITDEGALVFADEFYGALAKGFSVDAAVTQGRRALAANSEVEWGTPVLFTRVKDGRLFDVATPRVTVRTSPLRSSKPAETQVATTTLEKVGTRLAHSGWVRSVVFHPDGERIASASDDKTARLWHRVGGGEIGRITHDGWVRTVAFSADGRRLATGADDRTARVLDARSGREIGRVLHGGGVWGADFSRDGSRIATASGDTTARVWDGSSGRQLVTVTHDSGVLGVVFSPDGERILTAGADQSARLWNARNGREIGRVGHGGGVLSVAFSPDGTCFATASADNTAKVWDANNGRELACLKHSAWVWDVEFSPDGTKLATASGDTTVRVWERANGIELACAGHSGGALSVAFSPDGRHLVTASGYAHEDPDDALTTLIPKRFRPSRVDGYVTLWRFTGA
ncbi:MAG TPA: CHAT domain-containing protein [Solirubrobacter sp.]|nr:CHAT domain-containing protein [Solirubrobacter sp.]